ncbi:MAG TPA: membrane dipeptidase [Gemmatimonadaceae bacterium]|nr:membrane dipeptidase [Gemmatimonadaceae bacterium]
MALTRRQAIRALASATAALAGAPAVLRGRFRLFGAQGRTYSARAIRLVEETLVIDMLNQFRFADHAERPPKSQRWLGTPGAFRAPDWEEYRTSGIRVFGLGHGASDYAAGIRFFADWNGFIASYDQWFMRIDDMADLDRVRGSGRVGLLLTFQNSDHFRTAADVTTFFALGQRASQLTYNYANRLGAGFLEQNDGGLTVFGAEVVQRMNEVGMAVDLSHCGDRTTLDGIAASSKPVIFSHASCRALVPGHLRCKTDEMIRGLARTGGVMGIPFLRMMIRDREPVTTEHVLDHFDHVARLVGVEHVGVGSDMDVVGNPNPVNGEPIRPTPNWDRYRLHTDENGRLTIAGLDHARRMYDLAEGMIARRHADADIALMLGGNWRRVLGTIWPA